MASSSGSKASDDVRVFDHLLDLSISLVEYISEISQKAVKERGFFAIALSDGSLISLIEKLCTRPYTEILDWDKWYILWADERHVPKYHKYSNYKLAMDGFLMRAPVVHSQVYSIKDNVPAEEATARYEFDIRQLVKQGTVGVSAWNDKPMFDLILLSMGADGHVASLYPNNPALYEVRDWVTLVDNAPDPPHERITFTMSVINSASNVALVAIGSDKAELVRQAISEEAKPLALPAQMVHPYFGKRVWFLDSSAASKLDDSKSAS